MRLANAAFAFLVISLACAPTSSEQDSGSCVTCEGSAQRPVTPDSAAVEDCPGSEDCAASCDTLVRYPSDATHSPLSCAVAERLRAVAARGPALRDDSFMKVGDSISATHEFLHCFSTEDFDLADTGHGALQPAREHFSGAEIQGTTPFARLSAAARVGMTARWALEGRPPPVALEMTTMSPRYALVMYGTNDVQFGGPTAPANVKYEFMAKHMLELLDWHLERGVIPVLYSIPPYDGRSAEIRQLVPTYNAVLRAMAEHRQIPFVDYHREMIGLPNQGLRDDGVHPSADYVRLCNFDADGLQLGYNVRNLLTLQALDRVWRVTRDSAPETSLDESRALPLAGTGSEAQPYLVDGLPLGDMWNPTRGGQEIELGAACEAGPGAVRRVRYQVSFDEPTPLRIVALGFRDARVRITTTNGAAPACPAATALVERTFPAGTHSISLDVVRPAAGEAVLVMDRCTPDDVRCR